MKNNLWDAIISYLALKFQRWIFLFLVFSWRESEILSDAWPHLIMLQWEEIDRLPTFERLKSSLFDEDDEHGDAIRGKRVVDVTSWVPRKVMCSSRNLSNILSMIISNCCIKFEKEWTSNIFISANLECQLANDLMGSLDKICWINSCRVGVKLPTIEVRYTNLSIEAECEVVYGKPLPTLWNSFKSMISVSFV